MLKNASDRLNDTSELAVGFVKDVTHAHYSFCRSAMYKQNAAVPTQT